MSLKKNMALLTLHGSNGIPIPTPMDVRSKTVMLEDLFWKKSQDKILEAAPPFEFIDSESTREELAVTLDSYKTFYRDNPDELGSTIKARSIYE